MVAKKLRDSLYVFFHNPQSSKMSVAFSAFIAVMVVISTVILIVQTIPGVYDSEDISWFVVECVIVSIFTVEYVLRLLAYSSTREHMIHFIFSIKAIIDLLSILPFYIFLIINSFRPMDAGQINFIRLLRIIRLFKIFRYLTFLEFSIDTIIDSFKISMEALAAWFFFLLLAVIFFSAVIYFVERGSEQSDGNFLNSEGNPSQFDSIPATIYFVLTTITTVGYGDLVPITPLGKICTFPLMLTGILFIALPSIIIGTNFAHTWKQKKSRLETDPTRDDSMSLFDFSNPSTESILTDMLNQTKKNAILLESLLYQQRLGQINESYDQTETNNDSLSDENETV